jgi:hypothetical protein
MAKVIKPFTIRTPIHRKSPAKGLTLLVGFKLFKRSYTAKIEPMRAQGTVMRNHSVIMLSRAVPGT